jgi:propanol-preferring alcohol dehydrogenase
VKAWSFTAVGEELQHVERPDPVPGDGQVVVDVRAAGLCHSDIGFMDGTLTSMLAFTPIVLGHEVAGVVSALGPGVTEFAVGDRVGIAGLGLDAPGIVLDGGFAERTIGKVGQLVPLPDGVSFAQGAAGTDAGQTSHHAVVTVGGAAPGMRVGVVGLGGLGLTGARIAVLSGAEVFAAEVNEEVWPLALERGVTTCVGDVLDLAGLDLDLVVDFAGFGTTTAGAVEVVRPGGTVVQVGLGRSEALISTNTLVSHQVHLVGSLGGSKADVEAVYSLVASGELEMSVTSIGFDEIPEGFHRLEQGGVRGRLVAETR